MRHTIWALFVINLCWAVAVAVGAGSWMASAGRGAQANLAAASQRRLRTKKP